jgi:predicted transcriptional regulator
MHVGFSESFPSTAGKRSRIRLCLDVLKTISRGVMKPTNIMYRSNLSWVTLMEILEFLTETGFIEVETEGRRRVYRITEKGLNALNYYRRIEETLIVVRRPGKF